jgi:hypothetical protein
MFPSRIKHALVDFRSVGVPPAWKNAVATPARRFAGRAIAWLAVLALVFAWSGQGFAKEKASPNKAKNVTISTAVDVEQSKTDKSGKRTATVTVTVAGGGMGQFPATLDQALTAALESSPKVMVAKAKVTIAEAEMSAAQMDVARKIVQLWTERQVRQAEYDRWLEANKRVPGSVPTENVINSGAAVAQLEMELRSLIGQASSTAPRVGHFNTSVNIGSNRSVAFERPAKPLQLPHGPVVEKIRKALMSQTEAVFVEAPLQEVMDFMKEKHKIEIQIDARALEEAGVSADTPMTVDLKGLTLGDLFQAWDDKMPDLKFVVRNYGILITTPERAREQGYFPVVDFARLTAGGGRVIRKVVGPDGNVQSERELWPATDGSPGPTFEQNPGPTTYGPPLRPVPNAAAESLRTYAPPAPNSQSLGPVGPAIGPGPAHPR